MRLKIQSLPFVAFSILLLCCSLSVNSYAAGGYAGKVFERKADSSIGSPIAGVTVTFVREDGAVIQKVTTDANGSYQVGLSPARYWVMATHQGYEDYCSIPGFFVVIGKSFQTGNIFLRKPKITTLLLVRHADRTSGDDLTEVGQQRAYQLSEVARKAGVTAIYTTDTQRTRKTAKPLADLLKLDVKIYSDAVSLLQQVESQNIGDVMLVVGHSDTLAGIANKFCPTLNSNTILLDFDTLLVVSRKVDSTTANVVNLQYGNTSSTSGDSQPIVDYSMTTVLLVRNFEGKPDRATTLKEVVRKAGKTKATTTLYATQNSQQILQPLATELGINISTYNQTDLQTLVNSFTSSPAGHLFIVAADAITTKNLVKSFGGNATVFSNEYDDLLLVTLGGRGQSKIVNLQYGEPSPSPKLIFTGTKPYTANGKKWIKYELAITNKESVPADIFASAPDLPPCGANDNASRTWVDIYSDEDDKRLYGFCALKSSESLDRLWFAVEQGTKPPKKVYVLLHDRKANIFYRSNSVLLR
ncbi:MAG: carboxypeptidase regulatory-like domain-containing protein [Blastocatellia bacterium]|nr:carboxypeptidase regulatory-like domain-containing protein [Blastocatellia bacterium]